MKIILLLSTLLCINSFSKESLYDPITKKTYDASLTRGIARNMFYSFLRGDVDISIDEYLDTLIKANPSYKERLVNSFVDVFKIGYTSSALNGSGVSDIDIEKVQNVVDLHSNSDPDFINTFNSLQEIKNFVDQAEVNSLPPKMRKLLMDNLTDHRAIYKYLHLFEGDERSRLIGRSLTHMSENQMSDEMIKMAKEYPFEVNNKVCEVIDHRMRIYGDAWSKGNKEAIEAILKYSQEVEKEEELKEVKADYRKNIVELKDVLSKFEGIGINERTYCSNFNKTIFDIINDADIFYQEDVESLVYNSTNENALSSRPLNTGSCDRDLLYTQIYNSNLKAKRMGVNYTFAESFKICDVLIEIFKSPLKNNVGLTLKYGEKVVSKEGSYEEIIGEFE